jgi:hypothetical protein
MFARRQKRIDFAMEVQSGLKFDMRSGGDYSPEQ